MVVQELDKYKVYENMAGMRNGIDGIEVKAHFSNSDADGINFYRYIFNRDGAAKGASLVARFPKTVCFQQV